MALVKLLGEKLKTKDGEVSTAEALKGKQAVALYFSAHWCPPCRGFTPKLAEAYTGLVAAGKSFEIVFVSSDREESAFEEYFGEQPWLAPQLWARRGEGRRLAPGGPRRGAGWCNSLRTGKDRRARMGGCDSWELKLLRL